MLISNVFSTLSNIYQTRSDEISKAVRLLHYKQYNKLLLNKNLYDAVVETMKHEKTCLYNLKICIDYKSFPKHKKNIALWLWWNTQQPKLQCCKFLLFDYQILSHNCLQKHNHQNKEWQMTITINNYFSLFIYDGKFLLGKTGGCWWSSAE